VKISFFLIALISSVLLGVAASAEIEPLPSVYSLLLKNQQVETITYPITVNPEVGVTVTTDPVGQAAAGVMVSVIIADIEPGKQFSSIGVQSETGIEITANIVAEGQEYTFEMPAEAAFITVAVEDSDFEGGMGIASNPYRISTPAQLDKVRNHKDKHFELINDIDMSGYVWVPIGDTNSGSFYGSLDGNHFVIRNLTTTSAVRMSGLFGYVIDAEISNLGIVDATVSPTIVHEHQVGILAGYVVRTIITNCSTSGSVSGGGVGGSVTGGLVGFLVDGSIIDQCFSTAAVTGAPGGGLVGGTQPGTAIRNSYSAGSINTPSGGGLVQYIQSEVTNSYTITVAGEGNYLFTQGISDGPVTGCYYKTVDGKTGVGVDTTDPPQVIQGVSDDDLKNLSTYVNWDFSTVWGINPAENGGYPFLRWQGYEHVGN
jgi:hypothetical protein